MKESSIANARYRIIGTRYVIKLAVSFCNNSRIGGAQSVTKFRLSMRLTQEDTQEKVELCKMINGKRHKLFPMFSKRKVNMPWLPHVRFQEVFRAISLRICKHRLTTHNSVAVVPWRHNMV